MITKDDVVQYAQKARVGIDMARNEIALTFLLERIANSEINDRVIFKGGSAIKKFILGPTGRFSVDVDFAALSQFRGENLDNVKEALLLLVENDAEDEVSFYIDSFEEAGPGTIQADCSYTSNFGDGNFEMDITESKTPPILGTKWKTPISQSYFSLFDFTPSPILTTYEAEGMAEKLAAIHRRSDNRNPKDIFDLWSWFSKNCPAKEDVDALKKLWPVRLWLDGQTWRGPSWFENVRAKDFDWYMLEKTVGGGVKSFEPEKIIAELKERILEWIDKDPYQILKDAKSHSKSLREINGEVTRILKRLNNNEISLV
jgi:predicted nucleotidyltransferase component of viral defense system